MILHVVGIDQWIYSGNKKLFRHGEGQPATHIIAPVFFLQGNKVEKRKDVTEAGIIT